MKIVSHFPAVGVSNTYVIGPDKGGPSLLVDPGRFDVSLLELIETNHFRVSAVLITHDHDNHVRGLDTLLRIYDAQVIAGRERVRGHQAKKVRDGSTGAVDGIGYRVLYVKGHSPDSRIYRVGPYLFTGDTISAGRIGASPDMGTRRELINSLRATIFRLPDEAIILPGHGPPSTVGAERKWNPDLRPANTA